MLSLPDVSTRRGEPKSCRRVEPTRRAPRGSDDTPPIPAPGMSSVVARPIGGPGACIPGRGEGGADDAGIVEQLRGDDLGTDLHVVEVLLRLLAHAAAQDDEVRPQQVLEVPQIARESLRPCVPGQALPLTRGIRRTGL